MKTRVWLGAESNRRHVDFQSTALPTELPSRFGHERRRLFSACQILLWSTTKKEAVTTVRYRRLNALLLNEFIQEHRRFEASNNAIILQFFEEGRNDSLHYDHRGNSE
jgi:hypothetical protein